MIVIAHILDAKKLTNIALQAKALWGYSDKLIESWRNDLTVTQQMIEERNVYKFLVDDTVAGFYMLNPVQEKNCELEMLFVLPNFIGKTIGKQLLEHAFLKAKELKATSLTLVSDPNAEGFYASKGFKVIDKKESTIAGRFLPVMKKVLLHS